MTIINAQTEAGREFLSKLKNSEKICLEKQDDINQRIKIAEEELARLKNELQPTKVLEAGMAIWFISPCELVIRGYVVCPPNSRRCGWHAIRTSTESPSATCWIDLSPESDAKSNIGTSTYFVEDFQGNLQPLESYIIPEV
jgi:uncharacterized small protein (DUF1192 family)